MLPRSIAEDTLDAAATPARGEECLHRYDDIEYSVPQGELELTVLMPCLNEVRTLGTCILKAQRFMRDAAIRGEVLIADNGSTDGSQELARSLGARVVHAPQRGYGAALLTGIRAASGRFVVMGDSDDSYDFSALSPFIERLRAGDELVVGNRFLGGIEPGAMPWHHRFVGNPVLTSVGRQFFKSPIGDFHCGLRGFRRDSIRALKLSCTGMEFASEMIAKASLANLRISEVPTRLRVDGRDRPPHLRSFRDGWRHLRFLLLHCPRWLFLYPGALLLLGGLAAQLALLSGPIRVGNVVFDIHSLLYAAAASILGAQAMAFWMLGHVAAVRLGVLPTLPRGLGWIHQVKLEQGLCLGTITAIAGVLWALFALHAWAERGFSVTDPSEIMRSVIPSVTLMIFGVGLVFGSFFLSLLQLGMSNGDSRVGKPT